MCFQCVSQTNQQLEQKGLIKMNKELKVAWAKKNIALYSMTGVTRKLIAKWAIYQIPDDQTGRFPMQFPTIAFSDVKNGSVYVGNEADFYIETDSSIIGGTLELGGAIRWSESLILGIKKGWKVDNVIDAFEKQVDGKKWVKTWRSSPVEPFQKIYLAPILGSDFVAASPTVSQIGQPILDKVSVNDGILNLDLENQTKTIKASIWIDIKSFKIKKAIRNGEQVFPK